MTAARGSAVLGWLALFGAPGAQAAVAVEPELTLGSRYLWRGMVVADGPVLQPGITLYPGDSGFYAGVWGSLALARRDLRADADELDPYVGFFGEGTLGASGVGWWVDACLFAYTLPRLPMDDSTAELQLRWGLDHALAPEVLLAQDLRWWDSGTYLGLALAPSVTVNAEETLGLGLGVNAGASLYTGSPGLQDLGGTVTVVQELAALTLTLDGRLQYSPDCTDPGQLCPGVRLQALGSW